MADSVKKYTVEIDSETFEVTISDNEDAPAVVSAGKRTLTFDVNAKGLQERFSVLYANRLVPIIIENSDMGMIVHLGCRKTPVTVKTERDLLLEKFQSTSKQAETRLRIVSPLPGLVTKVQAQQGATLAKGESIVIIEAMKMENEIRAPYDCTVLEINVSEGQAIDKGHEIALLE